MKFLKNVLDKLGTNLVKGKDQFSESEIVSPPSTIAEDTVKIDFAESEVVEDIDHQKEVIQDETKRAWLVSHYVQFSIKQQERYHSAESKHDKLFEASARIVVSNQAGSTSSLQRRLNIGYDRASLIMDQLEDAGIVGPAFGARPRQVYLDEEGLSAFFKNGSIFPPNFYDENKKEIEESIEKYWIAHRLEKDEQDERDLEEKKQRIRDQLLEKERKKQLKRDIYNELIEEGKIAKPDVSERRDVIPREVMDSVWNRDGGKCVHCGSNRQLEFDHIIPFSKGGATTYRNLQLLCQPCNVAKSNRIG